MSVPWCSPLDQLKMGSSTLHRIPNEIQQDTLEQRDVTRAEAPGEAILHRESDMPRQPAPRDQDGKDAAQGSRYDDDGHGLADR